MSSNFDIEKFQEKYPEILASQPYFDLQSKRTNDNLPDGEYKSSLIELGFSEEDAQGLIDWNADLEIKMKETGIFDFMELTMQAMDIVMSNEGLSSDMENIKSLMKSEGFDATNYMVDKHGLTLEQAAMCAEYFQKASAMEILEENPTMSEEEQIAFLKSQLGGE